MFDLITVTHNNTNERLADELEAALYRFEDEGNFSYHNHSNRRVNLGFAKACNTGAFREGATRPYIGFLNPDLIIEGPFLRLIEEVFESDPRIVITGERFAKPTQELRIWGVKDWVCGAAFFVRRDWFTEVGGFDSEYEWAWEETDLIRQAQSNGMKVRSVKLPLKHSSPTDDSETDSEYKEFHSKRSQKRFYEKWSKR